MQLFIPKTQTMSRIASANLKKMRIACAQACMCTRLMVFAATALLIFEIFLWLLLSSPF